MAKNISFRKIVALVTAIALVVCFAVSASAVNVSTTTTYVDDTKADVTVTVNVTDLADGDAYVTYYATNGGNPVHVDQAAVENNAARFTFRTAATNLDSAVLIGRTTADEAIDTETIEGYTVSWSGAVTGSALLPTEETSIVIDYTPTAGKVFAGATLNGEEATVVEGNGTLTVTLGDLTADATIVINEEDAPVDVPTVTLEALTGASVTVTEENVENTIYNEDGEEIESSDATLTSEVGNRKLTVIGNVTGATEYGIIIADEAIASGDMDEATFGGYDAYEAKGASATGTFAIQLVDEATADHQFVTTNVYAAVYAKAGNVYKIVAIDGVITVDAQ